MTKKYVERFCKFNDLMKSIECFYKKHNSAFTVAELVVTIIVVGVLVFVLLGFVNRDQQQEFDAKNYKTVSNINALIDKASVARTGNPVARDDVAEIQNIITGDSGLNVTNSDCGPACWGADETQTPGAAAGRKILLNDQTVIAFADRTNRIYIDANGAKGPNIFGEDIRELNYADINGTPGTVASCQYPRVFHESLCCPRKPNGGNERWESNNKCDICSKTDSEIWTADTGCGKCERGTLPANARWKSDYSCDHECTNKNVHEGDTKWSLNSTACTWGCSDNKTAQGYNAGLENVVGITKAKPDPANGCKYGYACYAPTPFHRNTHCCASDSKPAGSLWNSSGCGWHCDSAKGYIQQGNTCVKCSSSGTISGSGTVTVCDGTYFWSNREGNRNNSIRTNGSVSGVGSWSNDTCAGGSCCCKCSEPDNDTFGPVSAGTYSYAIRSSYVNYGPKSTVNQYCTSARSSRY